MIRISFLNVSHSFKQILLTLKLLRINTIFKKEFKKFFGSFREGVEQIFKNRGVDKNRIRKENLKNINKRNRRKKERGKYLEKRKNENICRILLWFSEVGHNTMFHKVLTCQALRNIVSGNPIHGVLNFNSANFPFDVID